MLILLHLRLQLHGLVLDSNLSSLLSSFRFSGGNTAESDRQTHRHRHRHTGNTVEATQEKHFARLCRTKIQSTERVSHHDKWQVTAAPMGTRWARDRPLETVGDGPSMRRAGSPAPRIFPTSCASFCETQKTLAASYGIL
jgi:hypothetical protein